MKTSNLTKGILGAALFSLSSCLWAADSNVNAMEEGYQVAHGGPGAGRPGPGLRKGNVKTRSIGRKKDRQGSRQVKRRRAAVSGNQDAE